MSLSSAPPRPISDGEREAYARDGAVILRDCLQQAWIARMREAVERVLARPSEAAVEYTPEGKSGRYLGDFFTWLRDDDFRAIAFESPLPQLAADLMGSREVNFFYDQLLVKEPNTVEQTPWHQDLPYWPLRGAQILSLWVAFDEVTPESGAMRYVRGSHRSGHIYAPTAFGGNSGFGAALSKKKLPPIPPIDENESNDALMVCAVRPGDVIAHHPLALHWSPGNLSPTHRRRALALRYLGDDAVYDARPGSFLEHPRIQALLPAPLNYRDGERLKAPSFPQVWPR